MKVGCDLRPGLVRARPLAIFFILNILMATRLSISRSVHPIIRRSPHLSSYLYPKQSIKSYPCPLWSSSFSFCLHSLRKRSTPLIPPLSSSCSSFPSHSMAAAGIATATIEESLESNPLLRNFDFPPFDVVEAKHVRPGIRALLQKLVCYF